MNRKFTPVIILFLIVHACQAQSYAVDLFAQKERIELDIRIFADWQSTDSTHLAAEINRFDSIYTFKVNSIKSNKNLVWSESEIIKAIIPFRISESNDIIIIQKDEEFAQQLIGLLKDVKSKYKMTDEDMDNMEGYQLFFFNPGILYEIYHQPYIEILKHFISKNIRTEIVETWEPNFHDSIQSQMNIACNLENEILSTHHKLEQDIVLISNYLIDEQVRISIDQGIDTTWLDRNRAKNWWPFMPTDYEFKTQLRNFENTYIPSSIKFERREPTSSRIEIKVIE